MKRRKFKIYPTLGGISVLVFLITIHIMAERVSPLDPSEANAEDIVAAGNSPDAFESADLSSVKGSRSMVLGQQSRVKKAVKEESAVLLNDPAMSQNWGIKKTESAKAWRVSRGSRKIVVAIIDTGVDLNHADLRNNLWVNIGEVGTYIDKNGMVRDKSTDGIDNDGNGFTDDVHGWNFVHSNNLPMDQQGHGTHVAGIIGAVGGNGIGISGVSPQVSLMALKYYDPKSNGGDNLRNTVAAIRYAVRNGADIINYSGGGLEYSRQEFESIREAMKKKILFIAAAGNERSNSDIYKYYPADYGLPNIISVTAIDPKTRILPSSNYGVKTVDIAAPGEEIFSTLPKGNYGYLTGTSQATAFVSGVAALIKATNPEWKAEEISRYIIKTGDRVESLKGKTRMATQLNSYRALTMLDQDAALNGVMASNTVNMTADQFASLPPAKSEDRSYTDIALSSRDIVNNLRRATIRHEEKSGAPGF